MNQSAEKDARLGLIREAHAPQPYEFETDQTYCPASDLPSDACHTCIVLAVLDRVIPPADRCQTCGGPVEVREGQPVCVSGSYLPHPPIRPIPPAKPEPGDAR